jgi:DNA-binding MarR family transcriptional regulator
VDLTESITYSLSKTGNLLQQLSAKRLKARGIDLTPEESVFMNQLWDKDCQSQAELNLWSIKEASTVTRQIDKLVRKGYVERYNGTEDRRTVFIKLTAKGKQLRDAFNSTNIPDLDTEFLPQCREQRAQFLALLEDIREKALSELQNGNGQEE